MTGVLSGHEERVTACSFCAKKTNSQNLLLASADDSGVIKIWNIFTKTIIKENKVPGSGKVSSLHWSPCMFHLIILQFKMYIFCGVYLYLYAVFQLGQIFLMFIFVSEKYV